MRLKGNNIFTNYLSLLGVKHTGTFSEQYFNEHPHKYSLYGLSKMLSDYSIRNATTQIEDKEIDICKFSNVFLSLPKN